MPSASAADAAATSSIAPCCMPSATTAPAGPLRTNDGSGGHVPAAGSRWPVSPSARELAYAVLEAAHRDRRRRHREPDALAQRQLDPAGQDRRGRSGRGRRTPRRASPCAPAPARWPGRRASLTCVDALAARAAVRPHQPVRDGLADLVGGQALVVAVVPFGEQRGHLVDGESGQFGGDQRALARAADHQRVVQLQVARASRRRASACSRPSSVSSRSVRLVCLPISRPFGFAVSQQDQPMRCRRSRPPILPHAWRGVAAGRLGQNL